MGKDEGRKEVLTRVTHHVVLGVQFGEVIFSHPSLHCRVSSRICCAVVVPEEESSGVGLVNIIVEIPTTRHR